VFPDGLAVSLYGEATGTATGVCSLVNATTGAVVATATIANGAATTYESSLAVSPLGEFDYIVRFRVSSGAGTVNIYHASIREP
jgi:hypothetical protein